MRIKILLIITVNRRPRDHPERMYDYRNQAQKQQSRKNSLRPEDPAGELLPIYAFPLGPGRCAQENSRTLF